MTLDATEVEKAIRARDESRVRALFTLAAAGAIDRGRLLDACLDAFIGDFPPNHVGWYRKLHDELAPSRAERAARAGKYLALLSATSKAGVTLGQEECGALLDAGLLDPRAFLAASPAALLFPQKSAATAQLKLIGALIKAHPELRDEALATVAVAFQHGREDVQAAALKLIARHGLPADETARAAVESLAAALSPVIAPDAAALGLAAAVSPAAAVAGGDHVEQSPVRDNGFDYVEDPGELVQLLARLIEDTSDVLAVERAMAGAVRLASLPLAERARLAGPLLRRAGQRQRWGQKVIWFRGITVNQLAHLAITWGTGEFAAGEDLRWMMAGKAGKPDFWSTRSDASPGGWDPPNPKHAILDSRLWEACRLIVMGPGGPLLAEPEFADGTIGTAELLRRLTRWRPGSGGPPRSDVESALLRLVLGADDAFWAAWDAAPVVTAGETPPAAVARAMYDEGHVLLEFEPVYVAPGDPVDIRFFRHSPQVFERLLAPERPDVPAGGGTAIPRSRCWQRVSVDPDARERRATVWYNKGLDGRQELPLLLPHQPELVAANLIQPLSEGLTAGSRRAARAAAEALPAVGTVSAAGTGPGSAARFGPICHLALVTGMAAANADTRIAAASAWAQVALDGRLDPGLAAVTITDGVSAEVFKLSRLAESLGHAALDPAATAGVAAVCLAASAALVPARPANLHLLLELAARCLTATPGSVPPGLPAPIADLAASRGRSKLAEAARRLARSLQRRGRIPAVDSWRFV
jgi:hypothetical protein